MTALCQTVPLKLCVMEVALIWGNALCLLLVFAAEEVALE